MLTAQDLRRIRWGLVAALLMIAIGVAAVLASDRWLKSQQEAYRSANLRYNELDTMLRRARNEETEIKQKIARFAELRARGIVGPEQRLVWVERIRQLRGSLKLHDLQYEFAPQRTVDAATAPGSSGSFDFLVSTMRLDMQLLHEGDLLGFLDAMRTSAPAFVRARECRIQRAAAVEDNGMAAQPQLKADCLVDWITIHERKPNA